MSDYIILTDSTCDLPAETAKKLNLEVISLSVLIDGKTYKNYLDGRDMSFKDFYNSMRNKKLPVTSAVNTYDFINLMEPALKEGKDILYLGFSSAMSGTYSAGCVAADELREKYPHRRILTVDTLCASIAEGLLVYMCALKKQDGATIDDVCKFAEDNKMHMCHLFTLDDLMHVKRGGRISASSAIFGSVLGIKPMLRVNDEGLMETIGKVRGRKAAIELIVKTVKETMTDPSLPMFVGHGDCLEQANELAELIKSECGAKNVMVGDVGMVCGSHSGPGILAAFYHGKKR